jgi:transcriptional regulator
MYIPKQFNEPSLPAMHDLMRAQPLATLITRTSEGLTANHIPFYLRDNGDKGILQAHVARSNPIWVDFVAGERVLVVFQDVDAYISPSWYASKADDHKVVPTWNYGAVHVHGLLRVVDDAAWIRAQMDALTAQQEAGFAEPWAVADAPSDYIDPMIARALIGIEIVIERLEGKWKVSQNQSERNRAGVVAGLESSGQFEMARLVRARE